MTSSAALGPHDDWPFNQSRRGERPTCGQIQISGSFSWHQAEALAEQLNQSHIW
jgi:hypothetical protein